MELRGNCFLEAEWYQPPDAKEMADYRSGDEPTVAIPFSGDVKMRDAPPGASGDMSLEAYYVPASRRGEVVDVTMKMYPHSIYLATFYSELPKNAPRGVMRDALSFLLSDAVYKAKEAGMPLPFFWLKASGYVRGLQQKPTEEEEAEWAEFYEEHGKHHPEEVARERQLIDFYKRTLGVKDILSGAEAEHALEVKKMVPLGAPVQVVLQKLQDHAVRGGACPLDRLCHG